MASISACSAPERDPPSAFADSSAMRAVSSSVQKVARTCSEALRSNSVEKRVFVPAPIRPVVSGRVGRDAGIVPQPMAGKGNALGVTSSQDVPTLTEPAFVTERLHVFEIGIVIGRTLDIRRRLFVAFSSALDRPAPIAVALLADYAVSESPTPVFHIDWVEVSSECRLQGIGKEILQGIEKYLEVRLKVQPGSESGGGFCDHRQEKGEGTP